MCENANTSVHIISQTSPSIGMDFHMLLRFVGLMNFIFVLSRQIYIQGREP